MTNPARLLIAAALFGLGAIIFGTLAEHAFRAAVDAEQFRYLMTAVRYLQVHSAVLVGLALSLMVGALPQRLARGLSRAFWILLTGTTLFASGIFLAIGTGIDQLTYLTPVGGGIMMLGWAQLAWSAWGASARDTTANLS